MKRLGGNFMNPLIYSISKKILATILIFCIFIYATVFICLVPSSYTVKKVDGKWTATYPIKNVIKSVNDKVVSLSKGDYKVTANGKDLVELVKIALKKSMKILTGGLIIAVIFGIFKGIFDSRRGKNRDSSLKILLTIIPISLPDVLIVAMLQAFAIWLIQHGIRIFKVAGAGSWHHEILPIVALSILPACYIARVTAMSIESCYDKEYVKAAIGKGCSSRRILWNHVMRNAIGIIFESLSNITAMIITNMMIVEYMFSYPGITSMLMNSYRNYDRNTTIVTIIIIGIIYFLLDLFFQIMKKVAFRPLKEDAA
ncbi:MAG: binding-protein-dependent transport system inner rane component [Clostridia bacterium]|jgi:ABC-type dipeptide/oligopeptide/nickel transport system permease component|nr:binding-protein-dependent transport system inner rane component [Clostridia bacterium]